MIIHNTKNYKITIANVSVFNRNATFDFMPGYEITNSITDMEYNALLDNNFFSKMIESGVLKKKKDKKIIKPEIDHTAKKQISEAPIESIVTKNDSKDNS